MNVWHKPTNGELSSQKGYDEPMEDYGRGPIAQPIIVQPIIHKEPCLKIWKTRRVLSFQHVRSAPAQPVPSSAAPT
jgi:hypothetical protein